MRKISLLLTLAFAGVLGYCAYQFFFNQHSPERRPSQAGMALQMWGMARTFPDGKFHTEKYATAMEQMRLAAQLRTDRSNTWEALGPKNIGGRTLCLAVNPLDTNILWAGSATGGLWKSTTAGKGAAAWQYVETGFPLLGVSSIALDPSNPDVMYLGTGEVYNVENSMPNVAIRVTRGTYGIGILKSTDGGVSWTKSLDWAYGDLRGVQEVVINPLRPATVFAATSEGLLRSYDAGATWQTIHNKIMAVDIEIKPSDTSVVFVTHGSHQDQSVSGIYRSTNGGNSFVKLSIGLPGSYSGKALIDISKSDPNIMYASIGNVTAQEGLYRSSNGGTSWQKVNSSNVASYQGWYSHDIAIHPQAPNITMWVGIDAWKSVNDGATAIRNSQWSAWYFGYVPAGGPEGPPNYVHADIHGVYYLESDPNKVYLVTDGGIFVSYDGGETFEGRNGGYQTQQFYANLGNSTTNPNLCIGGMQDNATAIYSGDPSWTRVIGGDGECAAIDPGNDQIMYGSSQYLNMLRSDDGGASFFGIAPPDQDDPQACFNGPFELAPSSPNIIYAGGSRLWKRNFDTGDWFDPHGDLVNDGNGILSIAIGQHDPELLWLSTAPTQNGNIGIFKSTDGGVTLDKIAGLPNRMCMDIAIDPGNQETVYAVFSGFDAGHIWKTTDGGQTWANMDNGLPDVPANTVLIDPQYPSNVYIGNDLGVWFSPDGGQTWGIYSAEAPTMLVTHLSISADRKLRVATWSIGVWQTDMASLSQSHETLSASISLVVAPNPVAETLRIKFDLEKPQSLSLQVLNLKGQVVAEVPWQSYAAGQQQQVIHVSHLPAGTYGLSLASRQRRLGGKLFVKM